jgi:hypothetical protein
MPVIYLDMDEVLVDFVRGLHSWLGLPYSLDKYPYPPGKYAILDDIASQSGGMCTVQDILEACASEVFWETLPMTTEGLDIYWEAIKSVGSNNVCVLTKPFKNPGCLAGKMSWIRNNLPLEVHVVMCTGDKGWLSAPDRLLVDDCDANIAQFVAKGGKGFLVPRPWNSLGPGKDFMPKLKQAYTILNKGWLDGKV